MFDIVRNLLFKQCLRSLVLFLCLRMYCLLNVGYSYGFAAVSHCGFHLHFSRVSVHIFCPFSKGLIILLSCKSPFVFWIQVIDQIFIVNAFSRFVACLFVFITMPSKRSVCDSAKSNLSTRVFAQVQVPVLRKLCLLQ